MLRPALAVAAQISTFRVCIVNCCTFKYSYSPGRKHSLYFLRLQFWCFTRISHGAGALYIHARHLSRTPSLSFTLSRSLAFSFRIFGVPSKFWKVCSSAGPKGIIIVWPRQRQRLPSPHPPVALSPRTSFETLEKDTFCRSCWLVYLFSWPSFPLQNSQRPLCGDTSFLPLALSTAFCAFVVCAACNWLGFTPDMSVIDISNKFRPGQSHFRCDTINSGPSKSVPITQVSTHPPNFIVAFSIWLIQIAL